MFSHPETSFRQATEVQRQYFAGAEQRRQPAARRTRRPRWSAGPRRWWSLRSGLAGGVE